MKSSLKIYTRLVLVSWFKALQRETKGGTDKISSKIVHKIRVVNQWGWGWRAYLHRSTVKLVWSEHRYSEILDKVKFCRVPGKIPNKSL